SGEDRDGVGPVADINGHHPARDMSHAASHERKQLRARHPRYERFDDQRRLGLAHEDIGGYRERLGTARPHEEHHHASHEPDKELKDSEVVKQAKECRHENDRGQGDKGKYERLAEGVRPASRALLDEEAGRTAADRSIALNRHRHSLTERAKYKTSPVLGKLQELSHPLSYNADRIADRLDVNDQDSEEQLQRDAA